MLINIVYCTIIQPNLLKMNNYQDLYSVYGEYNDKFYLETYSNHKDAYSRYAELSFKMLKQATKEWKKNSDLIPQFYETSLNGYNRSAHCRIGHIYVDRIPDIDEID